MYNLCIDVVFEWGLVYDRVDIGQYKGGEVVIKTAPHGVATKWIFVDRIGEGCVSIFGDYI